MCKRISVYTRRRVERGRTRRNAKEPEGTRRNAKEREGARRNAGERGGTRDGARRPAKASNGAQRRAKAQKRTNACVYMCLQFFHFFYNLDCKDGYKNMNLVSVPTPATFNRHFATISKLIKEYSVQLEFTPTKTTSLNIRRNMLHLTTGHNQNSYGCRVPGIYTNKTGHLRIASPINGFWNYQYLSSASFPLNKLIIIKVSQTKVGKDYIYTIEINGKQMRKEINRMPAEFENVKVYISNPWNNPQVGYVQGLSIKGNFILVCRVLERKKSSNAIVSQFVIPGPICNTWPNL